MNTSMDKKVLSDVFDSVDPMGIFFEENVDEYDPEIDDLLEQSLDFSNAFEIKKILMEIFHRWFGGMEINEKKIDELAEKISEIKWRDPLQKAEVGIILNPKDFIDWMCSGKYHFVYPRFWPRQKDSTHMDAMLTDEQIVVCKKYGTEFVPCPIGWKMGVSKNIEGGQMLINGLRHQLENGTMGWCIGRENIQKMLIFFEPLHVEHLLKKCPQAIKYLGLPPGWRFQIDDKGYEDVWEDKSLLNTQGD